MSYTQYLQGKAIQTGCEWRLRITINSEAIETFPETATFSSSIRKNSADGELVTTLSSADGSIVWVDSSSIELYLSEDATVDWKEGLVVLDIIRTDLTQKVHLGFDLKIPVKRTITRV